MKLSDLQIGQKFEICLLDEAGNNMSPYYSVKLQNINSDGTLELDMPIVKMKVFSFRVDNMVLVTITKDNGIYSFSARLIDNSVYDQMPVMVLKPESEMIRIQRRSYYRVKCDGSVKLKYIDYLTEKQISKYIITDLSGGGMCIAGEEKFEKNILLECVIMLKKDVEVTATCKVINSEKDETSRVDKWKTSLEFQIITEPSREKIISYVFQEQMKNRRKGLI